jgi:MFS family permease
MDIGPLRESPAFRRFFLGSALSSVGSQMTNFAVPLQVFTLTHSSTAVGAVGLAIAVPAVTLGMVGGTVVDAVDRRKLVMGLTGGAAGVSGLLAAQAFVGLNQLWALYLLVAMQSVLSSMNAPARRTFLPRLLSVQRVPAGAALTMFVMHAAVIGGPALAGVITAAWGLKVCYLIDTISFAAALYGVGRLPPMPPQGDTVSRPGLRSVVESLRFIRRRQVLVGALVSDLSATVLGMPFAVFPAFNAAHFGGSAQTLGLLMAGPSVGGVIGMILSGPVGHVSRPGRAMLLWGAVWGAGIAGFGLSDHLWSAMLLLAVAGVGDALSVVFRTTMIQTATPDAQRGRVSAAEYVVGAGCPQLGNFRAGVVASLTTPGISAFAGGLATVAGAVVIGLALPTFRRYQAVRTAETTAAL